MENKNNSFPFISITNNRSSVYYKVFSFNLQREHHLLFDAFFHNLVVCLFVESLIAFNLGSNKIFDDVVVAFSQKFLERVGIVCSNTDVCLMFCPQVFLVLNFWSRIFSVNIQIENISERTECA